jgi:hypothetical protein
MALTNAERQARYKYQAKNRELVRLEFRLHIEKASKLSRLAEHWHCTKTEALERAIIETWQREGEPVPGGDEAAADE